MDEHLPKDDTRHRAFLARTHQPSSTQPQPNLSFCKDAFTHSGTKPVIFRDLRNKIEALSAHELQDFISGIDSDIASSRTFLLKVSRLTSHTQSPKDLLSQASQALNAYHTSNESGKLFPECAIIAAQSLIQHAFSSSDPERQTLLLRAAAILELSRTQNKDYFPIPVLLIQLYRHLGLFSLAFSTFISLSIKNLQWETVGHLILTRIGTLHPHEPHPTTNSAGKTEAAFDPAVGLDSTLEISDKIINGISESVKRGLREGSYINVVSAVETKKRIAQSLWRRICEVEEHKVARMTRDATLAVWAGDDARGQDLADQRDTSFVPRYCKADEELWNDLECGPTPREGWLHVTVLQERLLDCVRDLGREGGKFVEADWAALEAAETQARERFPDQSALGAQLTKPEQDGYVVLQRVFDVVRAAKRGEKVSDEAFTAITSALAKLAGETSAPTSAKDAGDAQRFGVSWQQVHRWYVALDLAYVVHALSKWPRSGVADASTSSGGAAAKSSGGAKKGKSKSAGGDSVTTLPKEKQQLLRDVAAKLQSQVQAQARQVKDKFGEGGVLGAVLERVMVLPESENGNEGGIGEESTKGFAQQFGKFVEAAGGEAALETVVGRWLGSWEDACEGVLGVKTGR